MHIQEQSLSSGKMHQKINAGYHIMTIKDVNMSKCGDYQTGHDYYQITHSEFPHFSRVNFHDFSSHLQFLSI